MSLQVEIKNRINEILNEKKVKKTRFSVELGYRPTFLNTILSKDDKFFNLEHIEKICKALDYPVHKLVYEATQEGYKDQAWPECRVAEAEPYSITRRQADQIEGLSELVQGVIALPKDMQAGVIGVAMSALTMAEGQLKVKKKSVKNG